MQAVLTFGPDELAAALKSAHKAVSDTFGKLTPEQKKRIAANIVRMSASRARANQDGKNVKEVLP